MESKKVKATSITVVQQMTHQDANLAGNVHGGVILKLIDNKDNSQFISNLINNIIAKD